MALDIPWEMLRTHTVHLLKVPTGSASSGASQSRKRRNSPSGAVFRPSGAGNRAVRGISELEQGTGVEPALTAWEAAVIPIYQPCKTVIRAGFLRTVSHYSRYPLEMQQKKQENPKISKSGICVTKRGEASLCYNRLQALIQHLGKGIRTHGSNQPVILPAVF